MTCENQNLFYAGKRFYLVQRDSTYDENLQTIIILR